MLAAVGHPVAVNPDRELARAAEQRGLARAALHAGGAAAERVTMPTPKRAAAVGGSAAAVGAVAAGAWWLWRRTSGERTRPPVDQTARTFLAATVARATNTTRSRSFFMTKKGS